MQTNSSYQINHRLCRNPDSDINGPWCYTENNGNLVAEYCGIDECSSLCPMKFPYKHTLDDICCSTDACTTMNKFHTRSCINCKSNQHAIALLKNGTLQNENKRKSPCNLCLRGEKCIFNETQSSWVCQGLFLTIVSNIMIRFRILRWSMPWTDTKIKTRR